MTLFSRPRDIVTFGKNKSVEKIFMSFANFVNKDNINADLQKVRISMVLASARFWIIIVVLFLSTKNLTTEQIFLSINIYYFMSILLEYPTGVIGDYFSHKLSVFLGYVLLAVALFFVAVVSSFWEVILFYFVYAVGGTLISGSDSALLYSLSNNFKKDASQVKFWGTLVSAGALSVGGWLGSIDLRYPFYLNSLVFVMAALILVSIKEKKYKKRIKEISDNVFSLAKQGLKESFANRKLFHLLIISFVVSAFYYNLKWLYNPLFMELNIDVRYWGAIGGVALLFIALGIFIYDKTKERKIMHPYLFLLLAMILTGITIFPLISLVGLIGIHLVRGYFGMKMSVEISRAVSDNVRASVLSLKSLLTRLGTMSMVSVIGFILSKHSFLLLMPAIVGIILIVSGYSVVKLIKFE